MSKSLALHLAKDPGMKTTKYILRASFLVMIIYLIVQLNKKPDDQSQSIVDFKLKMLEKIQVDSLNSRQKVNLVIDDTRKFMEESTQTRKFANLLMAILGIWVVTELTFFAVRRRNASSR